MIIYKNTKLRCVVIVMLRRQGTPKEYYHSINKITLEKIIEQPRQIHKINRAGHINTRLALNIDMSHNIPFTTR